MYIVETEYSIFDGMFFRECLYFESSFVLFLLGEGAAFSTSAPGGNLPGYVTEYLFYEYDLRRFI